MIRIAELDPAERKVWETGRMLQRGIPRNKGLSLRELVDNSEFSMGWVAKWVKELEAKGLVTSKKIGARTKKGTTRFLAPKKSA